ncbi:MAG TPA: ATP-binding protein, partial [Dissulfurispiraceae bacterium]|nr:ATP-binding protein [Dissulfurispiraceae bacterium]
MNIANEVLIAAAIIGVLLLGIAVALVMLPRRLRQRDEPQRVQEMDAVLGSFQALGQELKSLREQLLVKERLAALGEVSAGIAHEFRNPMGVVAGYARLLQKGLPPGDERLELVEGILQEIDGMNKVMNELLNFSRSEPIQKEAIRTLELVSDAVRVYREGMNIHIDVSPALECLCDATLMRQVLRNLLQNAKEAGASDVWLSAAPDGVLGKLGIVITVRDNGSGLETADREQIFRPFYTTKADGTGIGLALVQKIVMAHGGSIDVESDKGSGTRFSISIAGERRGARGAA